MSKWRRLVAGMMAAAMVMSMPSAVSAEEATGDFSEKVEFSATFFNADNSWKENAVYEQIAEKFNVDMDFVAISWSDWVEKQRIWINSGDMPDVLFWDFNYSDYLNFSEQGMIRALPEGWEETYPNLAAMVKKSGIYDFVKEAGDGTFYGFPRTTVFTDNTDENGDVVDRWAYLYRKDWAEKLGIEVPEVISFDELLNLAEAFVTQDPGENGEGKTIGIAGNPDKICKTFIENYNSYCDTFEKKEDGTYCSGIMQEETLEGVKALYRAYQAGLVDPNFFSNNEETALDQFYAGLAGIHIRNMTVENLNKYLDDFATANPELNAEDCIGVAVVTGADGKIHGYAENCWWTFAVFNPDLTDEEMDRILSMMDYLVTDEGMKLMNYGIEGVDYSEENSVISMVEQTDEEGNALSIAAKYPCTKYLSYIACNSQAATADSNPSYSEYAKTVGNNVLNLKYETGLNIASMDLDKLFCAGEAYTSYDVSYYTLATDVVLAAKSEDEVESLWAEKMNEIEEKTNKAIADLNEAANN